MSQPEDIDIPNETFACSVTDSGTGKVVVANQVSYNGEFSSAVSASATYRVTAKSRLLASCLAERAGFHYKFPLQINFTPTGQHADRSAYRNAMIDAAFTDRSGRRSVHG